ncbi:MAG: hypothetical protein N2383_03330 [Caldilineales bacterium]|nr:hypothetical protein [Caldilineales bacterium]
MYITPYGQKLVATALLGGRRRSSPLRLLAYTQRSVHPEPWLNWWLGAQTATWYIWNGYRWLALAAT